MMLQEIARPLPATTAALTGHPHHWLVESVEDARARWAATGLTDDARTLGAACACGSTRTVPAGQVADNPAVLGLDE